MERERAEAMHVLTRWIDVADRVALPALVIGALLLARVHAVTRRALRPPRS